MPTPKPKPSSSPKPKATPMPKYTTPSVQEFRKSAGYLTGSMGYKEYVDISREVYLAKKQKAMGK